MSSPFRRSDHSRSSPVRNRINGVHRSRTHSHSTHEMDGYCEEMSRLHIDTEKSYQKLLDERAREQKQRHLEGLDRALEKHELIQKSARECVERIQLEQQQKRLRQQQEEHRKLEEERRKLEETQRKIAEEEEKRKEVERKKEEERQAALKRQEEEEAARKATEQKKKDAEEARLKAEREKAAAEKEAKDKASAEQAAQAQQQQAQSQQSQQSRAQPGPTTVNGTSAQPAASSVSSKVDERQKVHEEYLAIHQRLKVLRTNIQTAMKANQQFKISVENVEGEIKKNIGQINRINKKGNKDKIQNVMYHIDQSLAITQTTDITQFMYNPTPAQPIEGPVILVYMLHIFCKFIIRQMDAEVGSLSTEKGDAADALGIAVALVFSNPKYLIDGRPLIDIMWAPYHRNCPRLFGVPLRSLPKHVKNFGALAAGFAAITLRQFPTGRVNPAPNRIFWETVARIVNIPRDDLKKDHLTMLEWMLQPTFVSKFIQIYGNAGLVATRFIIMDLAPAARNNPKLRVEATGVYDLRLVLASELHLSL